MNDRASAETLMTIAGRVRRLTIDRRDPDRFFEERSEIANDLVEAARRIETASDERPIDRLDRRDRQRR